MEINVPLSIPYSVQPHILWCTYIIGPSSSLSVTVTVFCYIFKSRLTFRGQWVSYNWSFFDTAALLHLFTPHENVAVEIFVQIQKPADIHIFHNVEKLLCFSVRSSLADPKQTRGQVSKTCSRKSDWVFRLHHSDFGILHRSYLKMPN